MNSTILTIDEQVVELYELKIPQREIAERLGVTRGKVRYVLKKNNLTNVEYNKDCKGCGRSFVTHNVHKKFCQDKCKSKYNKKHRGHERVCKCCESVFYKYTEQDYCSVECYSIHKEELRSGREKELKELRRNKAIVRLTNALNNVSKATKVCKHCGSEYIYKLGENGHKYCSDECRDEGYKENRRVYRRQRAIDKDKRWRMNGKADYSITLDKLFERDNGNCHICSERTDYNDIIITEDNHIIAGNSYPSIDHVIPIAKGGLHRWNNVKLAHRRCNSIKSDKVQRYLSD